MRYLILPLCFALLSCSSNNSNVENFYDDFNSADEATCTIKSTIATCYIVNEQKVRQWQCIFTDKNNIENCKIID